MGSSLQNGAFVRASVLAVFAMAGISAVAFTGGSAPVSNSSPADEQWMPSASVLAAEADLEPVGAEVGVDFRALTDWWDPIELSLGVDRTDPKNESVPNNIKASNVIVEVDGERWNVSRIFSDETGRELFIVHDPSNPREAIHITVEDGRVIDRRTEEVHRTSVRESQTAHVEHGHGTNIEITDEHSDEAAIAIDNVQEVNHLSWTCDSEAALQRGFYFVYAMFAEFRSICDLPGLTHGNLSLDPYGPVFYTEFLLSSRTQIGPLPLWQHFQSVGRMCNTLDGNLFRSKTEPTKYNLAADPLFPMISTSISTQWAWMLCDTE